MNRRIEDHLEDYLRGTLDSSALAEFEQALQSDPAGQALVRQFSAHSRMIREALRPDPDAEPAPGFYARVMDRIEQQRSNSVWSFLMEPQFFRRLALASATLLVLLGISIVAADPPRDEIVAAGEAVLLPEVELAREPEPLPVTGVTFGDSHRDIILGDLTTYQE